MVTSRKGPAVIEINGRRIGPGCPTYIVAEMSCNHHQSFDRAVEIIKAAKQAGADAVKLQTYTPDTITLDCDESTFQIPFDNPWGGQTLYSLYREAYTPWEWQPKLKEIAADLGLDLFSSPFDPSAVEFLEQMEVPAYKVASFEIVDIPLIERIARTGKPIIMSTGMATLAEIEDAVLAARSGGARDLALLKCVSAYPARPEAMNLRTIPHLSEALNVPVGLSDHTLGIMVPVAAMTLGACIVEKHFTLSRSILSADAAFSLEPDEFRAMVEAVRTAEAALGEVRYGPSEEEERSRIFRRSLYAVCDIKAGEPFTTDNVRSIRPGYGLPPKFLSEVLRARAVKDIRRGAALTWGLIGGHE